MAAIGLIGSIVSAVGTIAAGQAQASAAQAQAGMSIFHARQMEQQADEERASAQRKSMEYKREGNLALSTLQARAASSGGGTINPTVMSLTGSIAGRSEYAALTETYKGENRARGLEDQATLDRMQADAYMIQAQGARTGSMLSAAGSIIGGAGSAFSQFTGAKSGTTTATLNPTANPYTRWGYG